MQTEAGFIAMTGAPDDPPARFGLSVVDFRTGSMLATATLAAITGARASGRSGDYDLSLLDAALHQTTYPALWYLNEGVETGRAPRAAHPLFTPSQTFRTADGVDGARLPNRAAPKLGTDTDVLLGQLGYGRREVAALRAQGVV